MGKTLTYTVADEDEIPKAENIGLKNDQQVLHYLVLDLSGHAKLMPPSEDEDAETTFFGKKSKEYHEFLVAMISKHEKLKCIQIIIENQADFIPRVILYA